MRVLLSILASLIVLTTVAPALVIQFFPMPHDDASVRRQLTRTGKFRSDEQAYQKLLDDNIYRLNATNIATLFGKPMLDLPKEAVLPIFALEGVRLGASMPRDSIRPVNALDIDRSKNRTFFYNIGDIGFLCIAYYFDDHSVAGAMIYHKMDDRFIKVSTASDADPRREWDMARMQEIKAWLKANNVCPKPSSQKNSDTP